MEMNTRIQVEYPVTEMITGIDIVKEQVKIASKKKLSYKQEDIKIKGCAIECRINACDCKKDFLPSVGQIQGINIPGGYGVRVDSSIYQGYKVLPFYDSMLAKLISFAATRQEAICIMKRALDEFIVEGVETNIEFNKMIMQDPDYIKNNYSTSFLEDKIKRQGE